LYNDYVFPLASSKLGKLAFHASAVEAGGGALAFFGGRKSALAANFAADGAQLLTNGGLALERCGQTYQVLTCNGVARPLRAAYFIGGGARGLVFERVVSSGALMEWVKHSFLLDVQDRSLLEIHFDQVAALANEVSCYRLDYPESFADFPSLRAAIVERAAAGRAAM
jgi:hypothetical protein